MTALPRVLVVGDHFIPSAEYVEALNGDAFEVSTRELSGSKEEQHRSQQLMEKMGPSSINPDPDLLEAMRRHDFIAVHFAPVPQQAFTQSSIKAIFAARAGVENVDVDAASHAGIPVFNVHGRNASAVAELALGLMLSEARNIARADRSIKDGDWRKDYPLTPREIGGSTVGLVGFGHVGRELAQRLRGFDVSILVADPYVDPSLVSEEGGRVVEIAQLFADSDFVSLQARVTPETVEMVDSQLLRLMKRTAYLINVGRSRLIRTEDLVVALSENRIAGAGLDVFDDEPLPAESPLRRLDNVTLTTHFGGDTVTTNKRSARLVAQAMKRFVATGDTGSAVNVADLRR